MANIPLIGIHLRNSYKSATINPPRRAKRMHTLVQRRHLKSLKSSCCHPDIYDIFEE